MDKMVHWLVGINLGVLQGIHDSFTSQCVHYLIIIGTRNLVVE